MPTPQGDYEGILRAIGATRRQMLGVFLLQGVMVGVGGALLGSGLGMLLVLTGCLWSFHRYGRIV